MVVGSVVGLIFLVCVALIVVTLSLQPEHQGLNPALANLTRAGRGGTGG